MCSGNFREFMAKAGQLNIAQRVNDQVSKRDPLTRALGYEGLADPAGDFKRSLSGNKGDSPLERQMVRNRDRRALKARTREATPTGGHIVSIAASKARRGVT